MFTKTLPFDADELGKMKTAWWYYTVEMPDGDLVRGTYADHLPFAPRVMQRRVKFDGVDCLDIGSAEGLLPILCKKNGANRVVATDNLEYGFYDKLLFLQKAHGVELDFAPIDRAENIHELASRYPQGFDFINLSGVLYHVLSPLDAIASARALLKPNGLMLLSTINVFRPGCFMEFNDHGRLQHHYNIFWYVSCGFFEYAMRMCSLEPIDVEFISPGEKEEYGYLSVLARGTENPAAVGNDDYPSLARNFSKEFDLLRGIELPRSEIETRNLSDDFVPHPETNQMDLWATVNTKQGVSYSTRTKDSRVFLLSDVE